MAGEQDSGQERTEEPTQKKLQDSKDKGQVARSRELNTMGVLMGGVILLMIFGSGLMESLASIMSDGFVLERAHIFDDKATFDSLFKGLEDMLFSVLPILIGLVIFAFASPLIVGGWLFSPKAVQFKLDKLNPCQV